MGKKILFWPDVYKEQGHWLPTFVWARDLINKGHQVSYMGIPDCHALVKSFDLNIPYYEIFNKLYPLGYTDYSHTTPQGRWKPDHLLNILDGRLGYIFRGPNKPDVLVSGYFTSLESLVLHRMYGVKVVITTTYLRHPENDPAMRAVQNMTAYLDSVRKEIITSPYLEDLRLDRDIFELRKDAVFDAFVNPLTTFHELIPCPKEFDYPHYEHGPLVHYVEPCMTPFLNDQTNGLEMDWQQFLYGEQPQKIIFATAGSQTLDYGKKAEHMFDELIRMMDAPQMKDCHLLLSVGEKLLRTKNWDKTKGKNITVVGWAPQRLILSSPKIYCALIHGGLATIKECIYYGVPFVIAPMGKDQMDNALRLRENGIDNMVDVENSVADCYLYSINKVKTDFRIKKNMDKMHKIFQQSESQRTGAQIIESVANSTT